MQTTFTAPVTDMAEDRSAASDQILINLAAHRKSRSDRFPSVDDLLERLTDDTVSVANAGYRTR